jgi:transposase
VITAVVVEGRSQSAVAREYGVSQGWISRLVTRYRLKGEAAFEPQSPRPHTSPTRLAQTTSDLIVELRTKLSTAGLDAGPHTIAWHLQHHHQLQVSVASISRHLAAAGLVTPTPTKRPKSSYIRFAVGTMRPAKSGCRPLPVRRTTAGAPACRRKQQSGSRGKRESTWSQP